MGLVGCKLFFSVIQWYEDASFYYYFNFFRNLRGFWWHSWICKTVFLWLISIMNLISPLANCRLKSCWVFSFAKKILWTSYGYCCFVLCFAKILKLSITSPYYSLERWTFSSRFNLLYFLLWSRNEIIAIK